MAAGGSHHLLKPADGLWVRPLRGSMPRKRKRQCRCFILIPPNVTMQSQTLGIVAVKSVGEIGVKANLRMRMCHEATIPDCVCVPSVPPDRALRAMRRSFVRSGVERIFR